MSSRNALSQLFAGFLVSLAVLSPVSKSFSQSHFQYPAQTSNQSAPENETDDPELIKCSVYVTRVIIHVSDETGNAVDDLTVHDFVVYEDRVKQQIVLWAADGDLNEEGRQPGYQLAYYPVKHEFNGEFRRIQVRVRAEGKGRLRVRYSPRGYFADKELLK
jgi:hypothetical protein